MAPFTPPFCPNPSCSHHQDSPGDYSAFVRYGFHHTATFGPVPRFKCSTCGKTFSRQTFRLSYYLKRDLTFTTIASALVSCSSIRAIGRLVDASCASVSSRIARMSRQSLAFSSRLALSRTPDEDLAADGFESFCVSQYFPNNITILVGQRSQFVYAVDHATLRRKGRMTPLQKATRARLDRIHRPDPKAITSSFRVILDEIAPIAFDSGRSDITLWTDQKKEYRTAIHSHMPASFLDQEERLVHRSISSRAERTRENPLAAVNYLDREIRKDLHEHTRETVCFARNVNNQMDRMTVYVFHHNFLKHFRIGGKGEDRRSHAEVAGYRKTALRKELAEVWVDRAFSTRESLRDMDRRTWFRTRATPLKTGPEHLQKRVAA